MVLEPAQKLTHNVKTVPGNKRTSAIFDRVLDVLVYIAAALLVFSWLSVVADVILRYFLSRPIMWATEVSEYILLQIVFLSAAWLLRREGHVNVDIVLTRLSPRNQATLSLVTTCICVAICLTLLWYGLNVTIGLFQEHLTIPKQLETPKYLVVAVIPLGFLMLSIQFIRRAYGFILKRRQ